MEVNTQILNETLHTLNFDIRMEVLLNELKTEGYDTEALVLQSAGLFKRNYDKDVLNVEGYIPTNHEENGDHLQPSLVLGREGIYDGLPKHIFHAPPKKTKHLSKSEKEKEYRLQTIKEEQLGRQFFMPLEQELYTFKIAIEEKERFFFEEYPELLKDSFWEITEEWEVLNEVQTTTLLCLLPILSSIRADEKLVNATLSLLMGLPITIQKSRPKIIQNQSVEAPTLGNLSLSNDFIIGNAFYDGIPTIQVNIHQIPKSTLLDYMPNGEQLKVLDFLCNFLLPLECEVETVLHLNKSMSAFSLEENTAIGRLAFTTVI